MNESIIKLQDIKLIIWDLDDCFWKGTISEEEVEIVSRNEKFIKSLNDHGIVNSICSKNDYNTVKKYLQKNNLWDEFVFSSVDWTPKGYRIKQIIDNMNLRDANVLFIDDNISNLNEAKAKNPKLYICLPTLIPELIEQLNELPLEKNKRKRLNQYRVLQNKVQESANFDSNIDFLRQSEITIKIQNECSGQFDRIYELIHRTNQLNYTKIRSTQDQIREILASNAYENGLIEARDKYGDYGIIGFYCKLRDTNELLHFCFSCRTLGMGIEQYIYEILGFPKINVVGPIAMDLTYEHIDYISINNKDILKTGNDTIKSFDTNLNVLFKGPCDLEQLFAYLCKTPNMITEFIYQSDKIGSVQQYNHSWNIINIIEDVDYSQEMLVEEEMKQTKIFNQNLDIIFFSIIPDAGLGVYENKQNGVHIVFGDYINDLTDEGIWDDIISGKRYNAGYTFNREFLSKFKKKYKYCGLISPEQLYINLDQIINHISKDTDIYFLSGVELDYYENKYPAYVDRHIIHKQFNKVLQKLKNKHSNVHIFDINEYVNNQTCFTNCINHWNRNTYFAIAEGMKELLAANGTTIELKKPSFKSTIKDFISNLKIKKQLY